MRGQGILLAALALATLGLAVVAIAVIVPSFFFPGIYLIDAGALALLLAGGLQLFAEPEKL